MRKHLIGLSVFPLLITGCATNQQATGSVDPSRISRMAKFPKPQYALHKAKPVTRRETAEMVRAEARKQGVPENFALAVAYVESGINPNSRNSSAGAMSVLQVLPGTARQFDPTLTREQMRDPRINIPLGIAYIKLGLTSTGNNLHATAARYEAGLASRRVASVYSNKVMSVMNNNVVTAFLNKYDRLAPEGPMTAYAVFRPEQIKVNTKRQHRVGETKSSAFNTPIGSLVYDPMVFIKPEGPG